MNTRETLLARYGRRDVPLAEVCERYFGVPPTMASRLVAAGRFPVPAFRARDSRKAPLLVRVDDLAEVLDSRYERARLQWNVTGAWEE